MARLNEMLGAAQQWSRGIAAQFGLEEQEGVPTVAPELVPTSDIHARPEQWALHGGQLLWGFGALGAGAGNGQMQVVPGVGELVIVEDVHILGRSAAGVATAYSVILGLTTTLLSSSTGNMVARDARMIASAGAGASSGTRIFQQDNIGATFATVWGRYPVRAGETLIIPVDVVLIRPWTFKIATENAGTDLQVSVKARARAATSRELSIGTL